MHRCEDAESQPECKELEANLEVRSHSSIALTNQQKSDGNCHNLRSSCGCRYESPSDQRTRSCMSLKETRTSA